jgi:glutathione S-transferase
MKLYGHPLSSCTRKVKMLLAEKGAEAEFVLVDLFEGAHKSAAHLARHPFGVVPVLDDDGFVLYESRAILRYLDTRLPGPSLVPTNPKEAARMAQWLSVDQSYVAPHTRALAVERVVKKHGGLPPDAQAVETAEKALRHALEVIDRALGESEHLAGRAFSLADISLVPYVASLPLIGAEHVTRDLPRLAAWKSRVEARPSWKRAIA